MTSITCPTVTRVIAGVKHTLRMDFNALVLAEGLTGKNFLDAEVWQNMSITSVTCLFWACSVQTNKEITLGSIRDLGPKHSADLVNACRDAWRAANEVPADDPHPTNGSELAVR